MLPDYQMIAEVDLYTRGVVDAKIAARKLVTCMRMMSELLSSQDHYDFGMRAVKSLAAATAQRKREQPQMEATACLMHAINQALFGRLVSGDAAVFEALLKSIFPEAVASAPSPGEEELIDAVRAAALEAKLQPAQELVDKCLQMHGATKARHGVALAGPSGGGKTTVRNTLAAATKITEDMEDDVTVYELNPKAITIGGFFGEFLPDGFAWRDGVYSELFRNIANQRSDGRGSWRTDGRTAWLVADGPIDAIWMENLNTVLDDNKKLCLMSGEIIVMPPRMRCIFETEDFAVASPATVSRLGIVYVDSVGGWRAWVASWLQALPAALAPARPTLEKLFDALRPSCLEMLARHEIQPLMPLTATAAVRALCRLLEALMLSPADAGGASASAAAAFFLLALTWSVGGCLDAPSRGAFERKACAAQSSLRSLPTCLRLPFNPPPKGARARGYGARCAAADRLALALRSDIPQGHRPVGAVAAARRRAHRPTGAVAGRCRGGRDRDDRRDGAA